MTCWQLMSTSNVWLNICMECFDFTLCCTYMYYKCKLQHFHFYLLLSICHEVMKWFNEIAAILQHTPATSWTTLKRSSPWNNRLPILVRNRYLKSIVHWKLCELFQSILIKNIPFLNKICTVNRKRMLFLENTYMFAGWISLITDIRVQC